MPRGDLSNIVRWGCQDGLAYMGLADKKCDIVAEEYCIVDEKCDIVDEKYYIADDIRDMVDEKCDIVDEKYYMADEKCDMVDEKYYIADDIRDIVDRKLQSIIPERTFKLLIKILLFLAKKVVFLAKNSLI